MIPKEIRNVISLQNSSVLHDVRDYVDQLISDLEKKSNLSDISENTPPNQRKSGTRERIAVTYRQEWIYCGKECSKCPHGPYWYAYWKENGKTRSKYIGKKLVLDGDLEKSSCSMSKNSLKEKDYVNKKMVSVTYRQEWVRCGKECSKCPHGPYWYAYWKENGKTRSKYIGKELKEIPIGKKV